MGARLLDLLGQHKRDLVIKPLHFGLKLLLESFDHLLKASALASRRHIFYPAHAHLPPAYGCRPLRLSRPDRRPASARGGTTGGGRGGRGGGWGGRGGGGGGRGRTT